MSDQKNYYDLVREELFSFFSEPVETVIEFGCGSGATLVALREKGLVQKVTGVELHKPSFQRAKKVLDKAYFLDIDNEKLPFKKEEFDTILFPDILEHLRDPWAILARAHAWLKPNGFVVVSVPNVRHYTVLWSLLRGRWDYTEAGIMDRTHLRFFTKDTMREALEQAGFTVEEIRANGGYLPGWKQWLNVLSGNRLRPWFEAQYLFKARKSV